MSSGLIYVIDDDKANNFLSKIMFTDVGANNLKQFYMVENAIEELKRVCTSQVASDYPALILLDINMPVKDGWDFLNELRTLECNFPWTPKIFITTSSDHPRDSEKAKNYPEIIDFLPKPMTLDVAEDLKNRYLAGQSL
jgi:CheY-like chemotaxis protein